MITGVVKRYKQLFVQIEAQGIQYLHKSTSLQCIILCVYFIFLPLSKTKALQRKQDYLPLVISRIQHLQSNSALCALSSSSLHNAAVGVFFFFHLIHSRMTCRYQTSDHAISSFKHTIQRLSGTIMRYTCLTIHISIPVYDLNVLTIRTAVATYTDINGRFGDLKQISAHVKWTADKGRLPDSTQYKHMSTKWKPSRVISFFTEFGLEGLCACL